MEVQGTIDCALRLGLPCYEDLNQQADGRTTLRTHFSNMNINGRSYDSNHEATKDNEMQKGERNADVTLGLWLPSIRVQINNENICTSYVKVPPSGFNCLESPSFHSDSLNHQKPVIPTRGRPKKKKMKKASDSKHCCSTCGKKKTPLWRKGPDGPQTLCNACGLRYSRATKRDEKTLEPHQLNLNLPPEELGDETQEDISF